MSSKRRLRKNACRGKLRYQTQIAAQTAMFAIIRKKQLSRRHLMTAYRCRFCKGFHYGHTPGDVIRKMGRALPSPQSGLRNPQSLHDHSRFHRHGLRRLRSGPPSPLAFPESNYPQMTQMTQIKKKKGRTRKAAPPSAKSASSADKKVPLKWQSRAFVTARNSTVLGQNVTPLSKLWQQLDWKKVYKDRGPHLFHPEASEYLHVSAQFDGEEATYRVRCRHCIGDRFYLAAEKRHVTITGIRVERLRDISETDAKAEGIAQPKCSHPDCQVRLAQGYAAAFLTRPWAWRRYEENPWVWVIEFKRKNNVQRPTPNVQRRTQKLRTKAP